MSTELPLGAWAKSDVGRVRSSNEDSFLLDQEMRLFVLADGMGGHAAGEVASQMAVQAFRDTLQREKKLLDAFARGSIGGGRSKLLRVIERAVHYACGVVYAEAQRDPAKRGMGTTLAALLVLGTRGFVTHVGDSRIYLCRGGALHQLTRDHSLLNELIRRGRAPTEDMAALGLKNAVTRAIGVYESVETDTIDMDVLGGDRFLLCSDGLSDLVEENQILKILEELPAAQAPAKLVDLANANGGKDNITAIVVRVPDAEAGLDRLAAEVNLKIDTLRAMPIFQHLSYQELVRVLNIVDVHLFAPGERVITEGEEGEEMFIVLGGNVRVHSGDTAFVDLGPGQHFGEMALIDRAPRSASVSSVTSSKLMVIRRKDFFDIVRHDHDVAVKLLWSFLGVLSERLRGTSRDLGNARAELALRDTRANDGGGEPEP